MEISFFFTFQIIIKFTYFSIEIMNDIKIRVWSGITFYSIYISAVRIKRYPDPTIVNINIISCRYKRCKL